MTDEKREEAAKYFDSLHANDSEAGFDGIAKKLRENDPKAIEIVEWMLSDRAFGGEVPKLVSEPPSKTHPLTKIIEDAMAMLHQSGFRAPLVPDVALKIIRSALIGTTLDVAMWAYHKGPPALLELRRWAKELE